MEIFLGKYWKTYAEVFFAYIYLILVEWVIFKNQKVKESNINEYPLNFLNYLLDEHVCALPFILTF